MSLTQEQIEIATEFADAMVAIAIDNAEKRGAMEKYTQEEIDKEIAEYREREIELQKQTVSDLLTQEGVWKKWKRGGFHPSNKHSRKMLERLYGVSLPKGVSDSREAVRGIIGIAYCNQKEDEIIAEQKAKQEKAKEIEEKERKENLERIENAISNNEGIDGEDLYEIAKDLGFSIHPRTIGTLRERVVSIRDSGVRFRGKDIPDSIFDLFREVQKTVMNTANA